jgi:hypothetical protein
MKDVRDYGAVGDGVADDREAFQRAINDDDILVPFGRYVIGTSPDGPQGIRVPAGRGIHSVYGGVLLQPAGTAPAVRLLQIEGGGVTIDGLELDGQRALQTGTDEHRAGIMCLAEGLTLRGVTAHDFTGDGFYFYLGADRFSIDDCIATDNGRNGLTIGAGSLGGRVHDSHFVGNLAQQFDSEPGSGQIVDLLIQDCLFDTLGVTKQHVLTVSGSSPAARATGWRIEDCEIRGGVHITWANDISILRSKGLNPTPFPSVSVYRSCDRILVEDCELRTDGMAISVITSTGTAEGGPSRVIVRRGSVGGSSYGLMAEGTVSLEVYDTDFVANHVGIYARATSPSRPFRSLLVRGTRIQSEIGIQLAGNGAARMDHVNLHNNTLDTELEANAMILDDGTHSARSILDSNNVWTGGLRS